jgi:undecaprenyl-diphosphatase
MSRPLVRDPRRALIAAGVLLILFTVLAVAVPSTPLGIDQSWSDAMADIASSPLDRLAHWMNDLGHGILRALTIGLIGLLLLLRRRWAALIAFAVTESLTPLAVNVVKAIVDRPRPPAATLTAAASSFPSGHAAYAATTAVAVLLLFDLGRLRPLWVGVAVVVVALMAWSRTYLQVHWLSDVVGGVLLGLGVALATFAITQLVLDRRPARA